MSKIDKENLIELLNEIFEDFEIKKLYSFKFNGKDKKTGYNKYEIQFIDNDYHNLMNKVNFTDYKKR